MIQITINDNAILALIEKLQLPLESTAKRDVKTIESFAAKVRIYQEQINETIDSILTQYPQNYRHLTKQIKLPLGKLHNHSPKFQINGNRQYIHALFAKHAPLMTVEYNNKNVKGNNEYSYVFFHPTNTTMTGTVQTLKQSITNIYSDDTGLVDERKLYELSGEVDDNEFIRKLYPELSTADDITAIYDILRVDISA